MSPNAGGGGFEGVAESQSMSTAVHRSPNKLWRTNSIFNLCMKLRIAFLDSTISNKKEMCSEKSSREHQEKFKKRISIVLRVQNDKREGKSGD